MARDNVNNSTHIHDECNGDPGLGIVQLGFPRRVYITRWQIPLYSLALP